MSAKSLLYASLDNCQLVRHSLMQRQADSELLAPLLDCITLLETLLDNLDAQADWDAEGFQSFLQQFRQAKQIQRELTVLSHLQTPLLQPEPKKRVVAQSVPVLS